MNEPGRTPLVRPRFLKWSIVVFTLLVPFVVHSGWDYLETRRLAAAIAQIQARHEPVSVYEFEESADPKGEAADAARYYRAAGALVHRYAGVQSGPAIDEALRLMDRAATLDFKGFSQGSANISELIEVDTLASQRTQRLVGAGRGNEAAASIHSKLRFARALTYFPAIRYAAYRDFETDIVGVLTLAGRGAVDATALATIAAGLRDLDDDNRLKSFLLRERAYLLKQGLTYERASFFLRPWMMRHFTDRVEMLARLVESSQWPWPKRLDGADIAHASTGRDSDVATRDRVMWREVDRSRFDGMARTLAMVHAARVAVAVALYRLDRASLPATLDDLIPAYLASLPIDPYSGKPVLLAIESGGYVAYSVGPNRRDDHGRLASATPRPIGTRVPFDGDLGIRIQHP